MSNQTNVDIGNGVVAHLFVSGIPTPNPNPEPKPLPTPSNKDLDPMGVLMLFPSNTNTKIQPFYMNNVSDPTSDTFACTYGSDVVKFEPKQEGNLKYLRNPGHKQTYASGNDPGKSCRFHITPSGGMFGVGKYSWKDKVRPKFLYDENSYHAFELTWIFRVGKPLGTHQSCADKMFSRPDKPDDSLRSTLESCYPNDQKGENYINYNYDHKTYAKSPGVVIHKNALKVVPEVWLGTKTIAIPAADNSSTWIGNYVNLNPVDTTTGKFINQDLEHWIFQAEYLAKGIPEYNNIPPTWNGMTNYRRIDGYDWIDLVYASQREILDNSALHSAVVSNLKLNQSKIAEVPKDNFSDFDPFPDVGNPVPVS